MGRLQRHRDPAESDESESEWKGFDDGHSEWEEIRFPRRSEAAYLGSRQIS